MALGAMPELTIVIPTFDRPDEIVSRVRELLPQLTAECQLIILDNQSPLPVDAAVEEVLRDHPGAPCTIIRNRANVGGNANILRAFEICETRWLWILGDDDQVLPGGIATIFETIASSPEAVFFNFRSEIYPEQRSVRTTGREAFAANIRSFINTIFISTCIYDCAKVRPHLRTAYHYSYCNAGQLLIVLLSLDASSVCIFSDRQIVHWQYPGDEQRWAPVNAWFAFMTILEPPMTMAMRRHLARAIVAESYPLRFTVRYLYYEGLRTGDFATSRYYYDQFVFRLYYFERPFGRRVIASLYRLILVFPRVFQRLNKLRASVFGLDTEQPVTTTRAD
jgi:glycosyltransferase involved in cell wall biosynthesis